MPRSLPRIFRADLTCRQCQATAEARQDQVSSAATEFLCSRCLTRLADQVDGQARARQAPFDLYATILGVCRDHRWTQGRLARELGVSPAILTAAKRGQQALPPGAFQRLGQLGSLRAK